MINLARESRTSRVLGVIRFPLAALIVFIHTSFSSEDGDLSYYLGNLITGCIATIAVPAFFFISGYLFFAKYHTFGWHEYVLAMRRKFMTLAVPYVLWIGIVYYGLGMLTGFKNGPEPWNLYQIFWAESDGFVAKSIFGYSFSILSTPAALGVLWFVRDLMVAMLLTPVFWFVTKRLRLWSVALYMIPYLFFIAIPIKGFGLAALCFFPIGATFSICGKDIVEVAARWKVWIISAFLVLLLIKYGMDVMQMRYHRVLGQLLIIVGIAATVVIGGHIVDRYHGLSMWLYTIGETSFFVYVGHALPVFIVLDKYIQHFQGIPYIGFTLYYFIWCSLRIAVVVGLYYGLKRLCPRLLSVMVGGRVVAGRDSCVKPVVQ